MVDFYDQHHIFNHMVNDNRQLSRVFHSLADPTRRRILRRLASGACTVGELAEPFHMSLPAVSKHLKVLEKARLVKRRIAGRVHYLRLQPQELASAMDWLQFYETFWNERLEALTQLLERKT